MDGPLTPSSGWEWPTQAINFSSITDGTSNTLLIGEKWLYVDWYDERTTGDGSCIDNEGWCNGWDNDSVCFSSTGRNQPLPPIQDTQIGPACGFVFGSAHAGGFQSVFCDGSVHFLQYDINIATWVNLCSRNDGQEVDSREF